MSVGKLAIVGLGPGDPDLITRRVWKTLEQASSIYLRTSHHPAVSHLPNPEKTRSFDYAYEHEESLSNVYEVIVAEIMRQLAEGRGIVYAVPGDPMVAEKTVTLLIAACRENSILCDIHSGVSFIEPTVAVLGIDASDGLQITDAVEISQCYHPPLNPDAPALIAQVYSKKIASDLKLTLMNQYDDNHMVALIENAGTLQADVQWMPLYNVDRVTLGIATSLFVPSIGTGIGEKIASFEGFQNTVAHLRAPNGCPWDREQTHSTLKPFLLEEAYEVIDAIDNNDATHLCEELGDLLLQIILHAQIATESGDFRMVDIVEAIDSKMKRRHPHVWGTVDVGGDPAVVLANWEQIKEKEKREMGGERAKGLLDDVPASLPALAQAHAYDLRARKVGFDWDDQDGVIAKVREEIDEIIMASTVEEKLSELGDLLLAVVVWARWLGGNPEETLRAANRKFYQRFTFIERRASESGTSLEELSLSELEALWDQAKRHTSQ